MTLTNLIPMLNVSDIEASLEFYGDALGFELVSEPLALREWRWATIRSGGTELMLSETQCDLGLQKGIDPHRTTSWPVILYFYPDDVGALYQHLVQRGYRVTPLEVTEYDMKEFSVQDPDGHVLSFGEDAAAD